MKQFGRQRPRVLPRGYSEEESSTVIIGQSAPSLEDVLSGNSSEQQPFDLASFMVFAERRLFSEAVAFLTEAKALRAEKNRHLFQRRLRRIISEFVSEEGCRQVNLSDEVRQTTEKHAASVLERLTKSPFAEPDRSSLDLAYYSVLELVRDDQYPKYMDYILVQRRLRFSRMEAQWWKNDSLTVQEFFRFPSPVDAIESRLHAALTVLISIPATLLSAFLGFPWLWLYLNYGFLARCLCGPRVDPQAFLVLFVLRPLVTEKLGPLRNEYVPGAPMRFAQLASFLVSSGCTAAAFLGYLSWMLGLMCVLLVLSFLWSACNFCIVCEIYLACVRAKLLPESICHDCSIRYVTGEGPPTKTAPGLTEDRLVMSGNSKSCMSSCSHSGGSGDVIDGCVDVGGGRRSAGPWLKLLGRLLGSSQWRSSPGQVEGGLHGEEAKGGDANDAFGTPLARNSRRFDRCRAARCNPSMRAVLDDYTIDDDIDDDNEDDKSITNTNDSGASPRPTALSVRNLLSFSRDITGLAATVAARPSSRRRRRTRMLADLEAYNNLFSTRLSQGGMVDASGRAVQGHGSSASVGSRATSRTNSCRTVSDLDVEPAADVECPSPSPSEDMSVDDENDFVSGRGDGGSSSHDGNGFRATRGGGGGGVDGDGKGFRSGQYGGGVSGDGSGLGLGSRFRGGATINSVSRDGGVSSGDDGDDVSDDGGRIGGGGGEVYRV
eukprot:g19114.t1